MKAKKIFVMLAVTAALCTACSNSNGDPQGGAAQTAQEAQESGQPETQAEKPEQKEGAPNRPMPAERSPKTVSWTTPLQMSLPLPSSTRTTG